MVAIVVIVNLAEGEILLLVNSPRCQAFHMMAATQII